MTGQLEKEELLEELKDKASSFQKRVWLHHLELPSYVWMKQ